MKVNAARGVEARAWARFGPPNVQIQIGVFRVTATPEEALAFADSLIHAAEEARSEKHD